MKNDYVATHCERILDKHIHFLLLFSKIVDGRLDSSLVQVFPGGKKQAKKHSCEYRREQHFKHPHSFRNDGHGCDFRQALEE